MSEIHSAYLLYLFDFILITFFQLTVQNPLLACCEGKIVDQWPNDDHYTLMQFRPESNQMPWKEIGSLKSDKEPMSMELTIF